MTERRRPGPYETNGHCLASASMGKPTDLTKLRARHMGGWRTRGSGSLPCRNLVSGPIPWVKAPDLHAPLTDVLRAYLEDRLLWDRGRWLIDGAPISYRSAVE